MLPGMSYYNPQVVGDYGNTDDHYKTRPVPRDTAYGVQGVNWNGSGVGSWHSYQNPDFPAENRAIYYDMTSANVAYQRYNERKRVTPAPLTNIPAYALPNAALMEGNYRPVFTGKRGATQLYVKVK